MTHTKRLLDAILLAGGRQVFTREDEGQNRLWPLPSDSRPVEELVALARLLHGGDGGRTPRFAKQQAKDLAALWQRLRQQYPSDFTTTPEEIDTWHDAIAQDCEFRRRWFGAAFHLERLQALRPGDATVAARLARAREQLQQTQ